MKLADLDPKLTATQLRFQCPMCRDHAIVIPIAPVKNPGVWSCTGTIETCTVYPSIVSTCGTRDQEGACRWHGFVTNGTIETLANDSWKNP